MIYTITHEKKVDKFGSGVYFTTDLQGICKRINKSQSLYETITGRCRTYFDLDWFCDETDLGLAEELLQKHLGVLVSRFPAENFLVFQSHGLRDGRYKISFHFRGLRVWDYGLLIRAEAKEMNEQDGCSFDLNPYKGPGKRQLLRIPYCSKFGHNRTMKHLNKVGKVVEWNEFTMLERSLVQMGKSNGVCSDTKTFSDKTIPATTKSVQKAMKLFLQTEFAVGHSQEPREVKEQENGSVIVSFWRRHSSFCTICDRTHDKDNSGYLFITEGKVFYKCFKGEGSEFIRHLSDKDHAEDRKRIRNLPVTVDLKAELGKIEAGFKELDNTTVTKFDKEYCSHSSDLMTKTADIIAVRAGRGRGKTNAISSRLTGNTPAGLIITTFRRSLVPTLADKFKDIADIRSYLEKEEDGKKIKIDNDVKRVICQLESLKNVKWFGRMEFDMVIDESTQQVRQLTSKTFYDKPGNSLSYERFKWFVRNARTVYLMDANLDAKNLSFFQKIRARGQTQVFWNTRPETNKKLVLHKDKVDVIRKIEQDLASNKKFCLASNGSIHKLASFHKHFEDKFPQKKLLLITQKTMRQAETREAMNDVNKNWLAYDGVIYSPSIQSGVSFDPKHFDTQYGIFGNFTCLSSDCLQMLHRVRHTSEDSVHVSVLESNHTIGPLTVSELFKKYNSRTEMYEEIRRDLVKSCLYRVNDMGYTEVLMSDYFELFLQNEADRNDDLTHFRTRLVTEAALNGYQPVYPTDTTPPTLRKKYNQRLKEIQQAIRERNAEALAKALEITVEEKEQLDRKIENYEDLTAEEADQRDKFSMMNMYGVSSEDIKEEGKDFFLTYQGKEKHFIQRVKATLGQNNTETVHILKEMHSKKHIKKLGDAENPDSKSQTATNMAIDMIKDKIYHTKYEIYFDWLQKLGFDSIYSPAIRTKEQVLVALQEIQKTLNIDLVAKLGKKKQSVQKVMSLSTDNKKYVQNMLRFINGSLDLEWGVTMKKVKKGKASTKPYELADKYKDLWLFGEIKEGRRLEEARRQYGLRKEARVDVDEDEDDMDDMDVNRYC